MRTIVKPLLAAAACGLATPALADDTQYWQTVTVTVALPDSFKIQNETVLRTSDARGLYELENNVMVGKKVSKVTTLWLGYTFDPQYNHGTFTRREHRFRQQINFDGFAVVGKVKFSGRVRLDGSCEPEFRRVSGWPASANGSLWESARVFHRARWSGSTARRSPRRASCPIADQ